RDHGTARLAGLDDDHRAGLVDERRADRRRALAGHADLARGAARAGPDALGGRRVLVDDRCLDVGAIAVDDRTDLADDRWWRVCAARLHLRLAGGRTADHQLAGHDAAVAGGLDLRGDALRARAGRRLAVGAGARGAACVRLEQALAERGDVAVVV